MPKAPEVESHEPEIKETERQQLPPAQPAAELVEVIITKFGEGKVSTGQHVAGEGDIYAKRGEKIMVHPSVAKRLEVLGVAEAD